MTLLFYSIRQVFAIVPTLNETLYPSIQNKGFLWHMGGARGSRNGRSSGRVIALSELLAKEQLASTSLNSETLVHMPPKSPLSCFPHDLPLTPLIYRLSCCYLVKS